MQRFPSSAKWIIGLLASALVALGVFIGGIVVDQIITARDDAILLERRVLELERESHSHRVIPPTYGPR